MVQAAAQCISELKCVPAPALVFSSTTASSGLPLFFVLKLLSAKIVEDQWTVAMSEFWASTYACCGVEEVETS